MNFWRLVNKVYYMCGLRLINVVDKCIIEVADHLAFSSSAGSRRYQCLTVCLRGTWLLYMHRLMLDKIIH